MVVEISGYLTIVDEATWVQIQNEYSWIVQPENKSNGSGTYVYRLQRRDNNGKRKRQYLHRIVVGAVAGELVDHINGDTLDNRASNLRIVNKQQNQWNKKGSSRTGYKGVTYDKTAKSYQAKIQVSGRTIALGRRKTPEEAHVLYSEAAKRFYGEYARTDCRSQDQQGI